MLGRNCHWQSVEDTAPRALPRGLCVSCPTPWCDCHEARVVFFDDEVESGDAIGSVLLDLGGPSGFKNAPCPCGSGRKYKECCLGKNSVLPDAGSSRRSQ